jgi:hypothetical protein
MKRIEITMEDLVSQYNDMINETTDTIKIGYIEFEPCRVLEELDPIAYRCGLNDYYDSICNEYICEDME